MAKEEGWLVGWLVVGMVHVGIVVSSLNSNRGKYIRRQTSMQLMNGAKLMWSCSSILWDKCFEYKLTTMTMTTMKTTTPRREWVREREERLPSCLASMYKYSKICVWVSPWLRCHTRLCPGCVEFHAFDNAGRMAKMIYCRLLKSSFSNKTE